LSRAVITGAGAVSAFGVGLAKLFDGLAEGRCAIGPIRNFDASAFPTRVGGEVWPEPISARWLASQLGELPRLKEWEKAGALRDRKCGFALLAAAEAWRSAGCTSSERDAWLSLAVGLEQAFLEDFAAVFRAGKIAWESGSHSQLPAVRLRAPVDLAPRCVRELLDLTGRTMIHVSACAAGALAVAHAASLVEGGRASMVVCGGTDSLLNPLGVGAMSRIGAPSPRNAVDACRPFDRRRDGLVIGEGAAVFIVESEHRARSRGARPLARILGSGSTQDAYRPTAPRPDGSAAARAMRRALERARVDPNDVGYINAHGTGTPLNDPAEARAIRLCFGSSADFVPVSSIKGALGHLMAASGAIEIAGSLLPFARGVLPATANHREPDPECDIYVIGEAPLRRRVDVVLSNSFGFGGQNATVVMARPA